MRKKYTLQQLELAVKAIELSSYKEDFHLFDAIKKYKADPALVINLYLDALGEEMANDAKAKEKEKRKKSGQKVKRTKGSKDSCVWHIGFVKPLDSFDLTDREQFKLAMHYTNLTPVLSTKENSLWFGAAEAPLN
jgi:hypothetical protein